MPPSLLLVQQGFLDGVFVVWVHHPRDAVEVDLAVLHPVLDTSGRVRDLFDEYDDVHWQILDVWPLPSRGLRGMTDRRPAHRRGPTVGRRLRAFGAAHQGLIGRRVPQGPIRGQETYCVQVVAVLCKVGYTGTT